MKTDLFVCFCSARLFVWSYFIWAKARDPHVPLTLCGVTTQKQLLNSVNSQLQLLWITFCVYFKLKQHKVWTNTNQSSAGQNRVLDTIKHQQPMTILDSTTLIYMKTLIMGQINLLTIKTVGNNSQLAFITKSYMWQSHILNTWEWLGIQRNQFH